MKFLFEIILLAVERFFWNKIQLGDATKGMTSVVLMKVLLTSIQDVAENIVVSKSQPHFPITVFPAFSRGGFS